MHSCLMPSLEYTHHHGTLQCKPKIFKTCIRNYSTEQRNLEEHRNDKKLLISFKARQKDTSGVTGTGC